MDKKREQVVKGRRQGRKRTEGKKGRKFQERKKIKREQM